jgi:hypothetical protein
MNNPVTPVINSRFFSGRSIQVGLIILVAVVLAGCSGGSTPPRELLLSPDDFPDQVVTETIQEIEDSNLSEAAVLVELKGSEFTLLESLVLFESKEVAAKVLAEIKQDQLAQYVDAHPQNGFADNSGIMAESLNGEEGSTLFFIEGAALVRVTLSGRNHADRIWGFARLAREKSGNE